MKTFLAIPRPGLYPLHWPSRYTFIKLRFSGISLRVLALPGTPTLSAHLISQDTWKLSVEGGRPTQVKEVEGQRPSSQRNPRAVGKSNLADCSRRWELWLHPYGATFISPPLQSHRAVKENCRDGETMKKTLCPPDPPQPRPNS